MNFFKSSFSQLRFLLIVAIVALIVVAWGALIMQFSSPKLPNTTKLPSVNVSSQPNLSPTTPEPTLEIAQEPTLQANITSKTAYGHLPYPEADPNLMMIVASYATGEYQRFESLDPQAGKALLKMIYAAREDGIWLIPVSGFRTIQQQEKLFQDQIKRRGSAKEAAKVSAPARYSEHHTGFAVDLADGSSLKQDISYEFQTTKAYRWLTRRAREFGFEISFPANNKQGVSFEPWHWRYVGSPDAKTIFANARNK